jgi:hypothetical protein
MYTVSKSVSSKRTLSRVPSSVGAEVTISEVEDEPSGGLPSASLSPQAVSMSVSVSAPAAIAARLTGLKVLLFEGRFLILLGAVLFLFTLFIKSFPFRYIFYFQTNFSFDCKIIISHHNLPNQ